MFANWKSFRRRFPLTVGDVVTLMGSPALTRQMIISFRANRRQKIAGYANALAPLSDIRCGTQNIEDLVFNLSSRFRFIIADQQSDSLEIGVPKERLLQLVGAIQDSTQVRSLTINDGRPIPADGTDIKAMQGSRSVEIGFDGHFGVINRVRIEPYHRDISGRWVSADHRNKIARIIHNPDIFIGTGSVELQSLMEAKPYEMSGTPVDAVYTWVNHEDAAWQKVFNEYNEGGNGADGRSLQRFHNKNELKYSLRSIMQNANWIRNIYIVSNCRPPDWLNTEHPRIKWVDHSEIIEEKHLPTFNSHVIESYLHKIPGLSEKFLYFNDDFYICKPTKISEFIEANGVTRSFLEEHGVVNGPPVMGDPDYLNAARNSARLLSHRFGRAPTRLHKHVPYVLSREVMVEIEQEYRDEFDRFRVNKFRGTNDLNLPSFLYHWYARETRNAVEGRITSALVKSNSVNSLRALKSPSSYRVICVNDGATPHVANWERLVRSFHTETFPQRASWEKSV